MEGTHERCRLVTFSVKDFAMSLLIDSPSEKSLCLLSLGGKHVQVENARLLCVGQQDSVLAI